VPASSARRILAALTATPDRTQKVKDARSEAQKEIEQYKQQKEAEFKKFEAEVLLQFAPFKRYLTGISTQGRTRRSSRRQIRKLSRSYRRSRGWERRRRARSLAIC
jgi:hypothetical protein